MERKSIGSFIAALRRANGMTQKDLAEKLSVSDKAVSRWERDESMPDLMLLPVIADVFHISVDELLRGEKKLETPAEKPDDSKDTAAEAARLKKQTKRVLAVQLSRLRARNCIALCVSALGVIGAIISNFGFSRGFVGFCIGVVSIAAAGIIGGFFCQGAWTAADDEDFDAESVLEYRRALVKYIKVFAAVLLGMLAVCLPFGLTVFNATLYLDVFIEPGYWLTGSAYCLAIGETLLALVYYLLNKSLLREYKLLPREYSQTIHGACVKVLCGVMTMTIIWRLAAPDVGDIAMAKGEKFDDVDTFVNEMNRRYEEQKEYSVYEGSVLTATEYYDSFGNRITEEEASLNEIYDRQGNVIAQYHQPNDIVGVRMQWNADGGVMITINTAFDLRNAELRRNARNNLITTLVALEPAAALAAYMVLRPGKKEN